MNKYFLWGIFVFICVLIHTCTSGPKTEYVNPYSKHYIITYEEHFYSRIDTLVDSCICELNKIKSIDDSEDGLSKIIYDYDFLSKNYYIVRKSLNPLRIITIKETN